VARDVVRRLVAEHEGELVLIPRIGDQRQRDPDHRPAAAVERLEGVWRRSGRSSTTIRKSQLNRGCRSRQTCSATGSTRRTTATKFCAAFSGVIRFTVALRDRDRRRGAGACTTATSQPARKGRVAARAARMWFSNPNVILPGPTGADPVTSARAWLSRPRRAARPSADQSFSASSRAISLRIDLEVEDVEVLAAMIHARLALGIGTTPF
jgi:hypothetical protein